MEEEEEEGGCGRREGWRKRRREGGRSEASLSVAEVAWQLGWVVMPF